MRPDPAVHAALRLCLAVLFASTALHKLRAPARFRATLYAYEILPRQLQGAIAIALPLVEAVVAAGLLDARSAALAAGAALALLCLYTVAIALNLIRGRRDFDCGCGAGGTRQPIGPALLLRNLALIGATAAVAAGPGSRTLHATDAVTVVGASLAVMLLWTATTRLITLRPLAGASKELR